MGVGSFGGRWSQYAGISLHVGPTHAVVGLLVVVVGRLVVVVLLVVVVPDVGKYGTNFLLFLAMIRSHNGMGGG